MADPAWPERDPSFAAIPSQSAQLLLVENKVPSLPVAVLHAFERKNGRWLPALSPFRAVIGRNGFAASGEKREGDGKTPSGIYPLESAFGYAMKADTRMPYRRATANDIWVDDPDSPDYNTWTIKGRTKASSFEELRRGDSLYKYGLIIGYNRLPAAPGLGSAIFVHLWKDDATPTSGCVALAEKDLVRILAWLDPDKKPLIAMGEERGLLSTVR